MAEKIVKTIIQIRRDTEANWLLNKSVIPASGEPCLTIDGAYAGQVKYGDGVTTWEKLPYSGAASIEGDNVSTQVSGKVISLLGVDSAVAGQTIRIGANGKLEWYTPKCLDNPEEVVQAVAAVEAEVGVLTEAVANVYKKPEANARFERVDYEFVNLPAGFVVDYGDKEIRILCPSDFEWTKQSVGATGDANKYYIPFRAYAPSDEVVNFQEDMAEVISDKTMHSFEGNAFAGIDEFGRKYSLIWLGVAYYDTDSGNWVYYGDKSTEEHMIGFHYSVRWYDENGVLVAADHIRINITNEDCHYSLKPYFLENVSDAIGVATSEQVGLVKGSEEVAVGADGSLSVVAIPFSKIVSGDDVIVMDGGGAVV